MTFHHPNEQHNYPEQTKAVKSFRFAPANKVHLIPTRREMSSREKCAAWYQREEIHGFREKAVSISRILRSREQQNYSDQNTRPNSSSYDANRDHGRNSADGFYAQSIQKNYHWSTRSYSPTTVVPEIEESDLFVRGLERLVNLERKLNRQLSIRYILHQQETNRYDTIGLSLAAEKCTNWAKAIALERGQADARIASEEGSRHHAYGGNYYCSNNYYYCNQYRQDLYPSPQSQFIENTNSRYEHPVQSDHLRRKRRLEAQVVQDSNIRNTQFRSLHNNTAYDASYSAFVPFHNHSKRVRVLQERPFAAY